MRRCTIDRQTAPAMKNPRPPNALLELCGLGLHADVLVPAVLEALHDVVPSYRNLFDWTDEDGRLARYFVEGPIDAAIAQLYFDEFHNRREAEVMPRFEAVRAAPAGVTGPADLDHAGFYASDFYNAIWRPQGLRTRMQAVLRGRQGRLLGQLVLYREPGAARFTDAEERRLAALLPAFAAGLEGGARSAAEERHVPAPEAPETLLLTLDGVVCHSSPGAQRLLMMAEGSISRVALSRPLDAMSGRLLPMLLARLRERAAPGAAHAMSPPPSITHETASGQYRVRGHLLQPLQPGALPLAQVTLRRLEPHRVALERALRALPITPGQMAVCRWLYHGRTHGEIGQQLGVAPATVVDHVRKLYRALDLRSTLDLRAMVDGKIGQQPP
jgi:DNA-binding CsgD family transcriptional regulator